MRSTAPDSTRAAGSTRPCADTLGMTPTRFRAGGDGAAIRFAVGECSLGAILVAASETGVCAIRLGDDPDDAGAGSPGPLPESAADRRRCRVRAARGQGGRLRRGAGPRARPPARRSRHCVPAAGLAGAARRSRRARRPPTPRSPSGSERRRPRGPSRRPARRMASPSPFPATASCAPTARSRATDGASSGSERCSIARPPRDDGRQPRPRAGRTYLGRRIAALDWPRLADDLDAHALRDRALAADAGRVPRARRDLHGGCARSAAGS